MRRLSLAFDIAGALLVTTGACALASLAHPFLAVLVGGVLLLIAGHVLEPRRRGSHS